MVEIRNFTINDIELVERYFNTVYQESEFLCKNKSELPISGDLYKKQFTRYIDTSYLHVIGAFENDKLVGVLKFTGNSLQKFSHCGEFDISILKAYYGKNIAKKMIVKLFEWCVLNDVSKIELSVMSNNYRAIKLYESMGFEREGVRKNSVKINSKFYDLIEMGILLSEG